MRYYNNFNRIFLLKEKYKLKEIYKKIEFIMYSIVVFLFPYIIGKSQIVLGSLVNFSLIRSAQYFNYKKIILLSMLPSIGVFSSSILFSANNVYLIYFLPFIWIANLLLVVAYKNILFIKKNNIWTNSIKACLIKSSFLFIVSCVFVYLLGFPSMFLIVFGVMQLLTSTIGTYLATTVFRLEK